MIDIPTRTERPTAVALRGGLDLHTPTLQLKAGVCRDALNFECLPDGGYRRIGGYEQFDGNPLEPHKGTYLTLVANVTATINTHDQIVGATSAATGRVIYQSGLDSEKLIVYTASTGTFQAGETLNVGGNPKATVTSLGGMEERDDFGAEMFARAADWYRIAIQPVTGNGSPVNGVVFWKGVVYAIANNSGNTAAVVYKSTSGGWAVVPFYHELAFTAGTSEYTPGETVTQGGVSATVKRTCLQSGTWGGGTAAGRLIITTPTGGNFGAGAIAGGGAATASGIQTAITLSPTVKYEFDIGTVEAAERIFGVNGTDRAFEFDGDVLAPIASGYSPDAPTHVMVHKNHLHLSFGNSHANSGVGVVHNWTAGAGAAERRADADITLMMRMPGDNVSAAGLVCTDKSTYILYGASGSTFSLIGFEDAAGAKAKSGARLGAAYVFDNRGALSVSATQAFGNFSAATLTHHIRSFIQTRRSLLVGSTINREKSQYRLFFSDGSALYLTMPNRKFAGVMPMQFAHNITCACAGDAPDGTEYSFVGTSNGYVMKLDVGTSFDGAAIPFLLTLADDHSGTPTQRKRYRGASFELDGDGYGAFNVLFSLGYSDPNVAQPSEAKRVTAFAGVVHWDDPGTTWDSGLRWDERALTMVGVPLEGTSESISITVQGESAWLRPFVLNTMLLSHSPRGQKKGRSR